MPDSSGRHYVHAEVGELGRFRNFVLTVVQCDAVAQALDRRSDANDERSEPEAESGTDEGL